MAIFTNDGIDLMTTYILGIALDLSFRVKLYTNNYTPLCASVTANFTECVLSGYTHFDLGGSNWDGETTSCVSVYEYELLTFDFDAYAGGTSVYGYYVIDVTSGDTVWAERFSTTYNVPAAGGSLDLYLTFTNQNC